MLVAHLTDVQHGFWVVLGTLSVLRTNAAATGSTVLRALAGTVVGFAVGAALMLAIGTSPTALWIALPVAVLVAAYSPGTAPFAVGQAAFTVTVVVLFNLLVPAGWKVGLVRIQDVAIGCAVSLVVGALFWPRGAGAVVGDDLADAFRRGAEYLQQAVDWCLGLSQTPPDSAAAAISAGIRLDDALRGCTWPSRAPSSCPSRTCGSWSWPRCGCASPRTRWPPCAPRGRRARRGRAGTAGADPALGALAQLTTDLTGFYERVAAEVGPPHR